MDFNTSSLGYILDFLAGVFIVFSIVFRSKRKIKTESVDLYGGNPFVYESQLKAFYDGWVGVILLFMGTILHLFHFEINCKNFTLISLSIFILLVVIRFVINSSTETSAKKYHPSYDDVKEAMKQGKYD